MWLHWLIGIRRKQYLMMTCRTMKQDSVFLYIIIAKTFGPDTSDVVIEEVRLVFQRIRKVELITSSGKSA